MVRRTLRANEDETFPDREFSLEGLGNSSHGYAQ